MADQFEYEVMRELWEKMKGRNVYELNDFVPDQVTPKKKGMSL